MPDPAPLDNAVPSGKNLADLPYARGLPGLGSAVPMFLDPIAFLLAEYRRLGPIFRLRALHHRFTVLVGAEANAVLARTADRHLAAEPSWRDFSREFGSTCSLPGVDGAPHYRLRRMHQRAYSRSTISAQLPKAVAVAERELRAVRPGPVALVPLCRRIVTEQIGTLLLGRGPGEYLDDITLVVRFSLNCLLTRLWPVMLLRLPRYRRAKRRFIEFGQAVLNENNRSGQPLPELLADLRAVVASDPGFLSAEDRMLIALGPFIAGLDTVANTVAFMLEALLRNPAAYSRVEADADALLADGAPTEERLAGLRALQGATRETLRLFPVAPLIYRHVAHPFDCAGYTLPHGEPVLFGTTLTHFMSEHFPDPMRFDIDRYARNDGHKTTLNSFGLGPHSCLGVGFAEVQTPLLIAAMMHHARFELEPGVRPPRVTRDPAPTLGPRYRVRLLALRT